MECRLVEYRISVRLAFFYIPKLFILDPFGQDPQNNAVEIYVEVEIYGGNVDLFDVDELGIEYFDTYDVIDVLNGSLDDMGQSDTSWEVGYEVKDIIQDIILFHAPLYYLSHLEFDMNLRT